MPPLDPVTITAGAPPVGTTARRWVLPLIVGVAALQLAPATAVAQDPTGPRIGSGVSASGQRWVQRAWIERDQLVLSTSLPLGRHGDGGEFSSFPWRSREPLTVGQGSDFGTAHEWEIDGAVSRTVARISVSTAAGTTLTFRPRHAPRAATRRFPPLARYRYFVRFLPVDQKPLVVTALDAHGRTVAEQQVNEPG